MPERGWLGGTPRPAAHFLLSGSLARSISDDWARTYIQNLGEIALVFRADELGPSGGQELGVQVVLKPVAAEGIAVVDFDEQRAAVAGHAEIGGVAGRRIPTGIDAVAWAEEAVRRKDFELADDHVRHALEKCPESPRAGIAAGAVALSLGNAERALRCWNGVMKRTPAYLPLVVGRVADALDALGRRDEAVVLLHKALADNGGADVMEEAVKRLAAWEGLEKAGESVVEMLARRPSLSAFSTMMTLRQKERPDDEETKLLATLLQRHGRRFTKYQCSNCGFLASSFSWHCLGCGAWDSFPPRRIEDVK